MASNSIIGCPELFIIVNFIVSYLVWNYCISFKNYGEPSGCSKFGIFASCMIYIIFAVFRVIEFGTGGVDSIYYKTLFENANMDLIKYLLSTKEEPGFKLILWIIRLFTEDYTWALLFFHMLGFICIVFFLKNTILKNRKGLLSFLYCFLNCSFLYYMMNILRCGLVILLMMACFVYLQSKEFKKAIIIWILSMSIHISAIVVAPLIVYLCFENKSTRNLLWIYMPICVCLEAIVLVLTKSFISGGFYYLYTNSDGISVKTYTVLASVLIVYILTYKNKHDDSDYLWFIILSFMVCCVPIQLYYSIAYRMTLIFFPILYLCIYYLVEKKRTNVFGRLNLTSIFGLVIAVVYYSYKLYSIFYIEFENVYPYTSTLFKNMALS